jgi:hypothetical protein
MADKLKFTSWAEWDIEMRDRAEREAERERTDPLHMRINAWADALKEEARLAQIEIEEEAKRKWYEDVRLAVATILEEEAKPGADAKMRRVLLERARAGKAAKAAEANRKAKAAEIERLVPMVKAAFVLTGHRKLSISDKCVSRIRPHLPEEEQGASVKRLKEAIRVAKDRGIGKTN